LSRERREIDQSIKTICEGFQRRPVSTLGLQLSTLGGLKAMFLLRGRAI
jgi:hypothetical protein